MARVSGPGRKNLLRRHDLLRRAGKTVFVFSRPPDDMDLDGFQAAILHPQAELFVDFLDAVLLEAVAHAQASARAGHRAMLNAAYFGRRRMRPDVAAKREPRFGQWPGDERRHPQRWSEQLHHHHFADREFVLPSEAIIGRLPAHGEAAASASYGMKRPARLRLEACLLAGWQGAGRPRAQVKFMI